MTAELERLRAAEDAARTQLEALGGVDGRGRGVGLGGGDWIPHGLPVPVPVAGLHGSTATGTMA